MRSRYKKYAPAVLANSPFLVRSNLASLVAPFGAVSLEVGAGKGGFAIEMARADRSRLFLALERDPSIVALALRRLQEAELDNLYFIHADASLLVELLEGVKVDEIFLNFPDPWPKKGHHKRRLTTRRMSELYCDLLVPGGRFQLRTDNFDLYQFSLAELSPRLRVVSAETAKEAPVISDYEKKFRARGLPIYQIVASNDGEPQ